MESRVLRTRRPINYYEPDEPEEDAYEFCEKCGGFTFEYCSIHGGLLVVPDDKVPSNMACAEIPRAVLTAPKVFLYIGASSIPGAGSGVFARRALPRGVRFGPYCGQRIKKAATDYCWQVSDARGRASHVVDAADAARSNWMRYVNCARHCTEQNLTAYQYHGEIYYRTTKIIPRHRELLVFYGSEFATKLNIHLGRYNTQAHKPINPPAKNPGSLTRGAPTIDLGDAPKSTSMDLEQAYVIGLIKLEKYYQKEKSKQFNNKSESSVQEFLSIFEEADKIINKNDQAVNDPGDKPGDKSNFDSKAAVNPDPMLVITDNDEKQIIIDTEDDNLKSDLENDEKEENRSTEKDLSEAKELVDIAKSSWNCNECNIVFRSRECLRIHRRIHGGGHKFSCKICSYKTNVKYHFKKHEQSHSKPNRTKKDEKPENLDQKDAKTQPGVKPLWQCNECQNIFSSRAHLRAHKRIHGGGNKFKCDICDYETDVKYYIERHVKANHHSKSTVLKCSRCTFSSHNDKVVRIHEELHANKKAIRCDMCDYLCSSKRYLNAHILRVHVPTKRHQCALCPSAFNCAEYLRKHRKNVHLRKDD